MRRHDLISPLDTRSKYARQGLSTELHRHLEKIAGESGAPERRTEASYLSRPAFTKFGCHVESMAQVERYGETFTRFNLRKRLNVGPPAAQPAGFSCPWYATDLIAFPSVAAEETIQFFDHDISPPPPAGCAASTLATSKATSPELGSPSALSPTSPPPNVTTTPASAKFPPQKKSTRSSPSVRGFRPSDQISPPAGSPPPA